MPIQAIPALIALGQAAYGYGQGVKQKKLADKLSPSNYVPPSVKEATRSARMRAGASVVPGYGRTLDKLRTTTANTVGRTMRSTVDPNRIQQSVADADAREKEVIKDLGVSNEGFRLENQKYLDRLLGAQGSFEQSSRNAYNATKSALTASSMRNKYNAATGLAENLIYATDSSLGTGGIIGKEGDALTKGLARIQKLGRSLSAQELDYLNKIGLKRNTLSLAFPTLNWGDQ